MAFKLSGMPMYGANEGINLEYGFPDLYTALVGAQRMIMARCLWVSILDEDTGQKMNEQEVRQEIEARGLSGY